MGISLKDLGNIAIGAIERDRELTADSAKTRQDELIANRNLILKMKEKKYDSDIKRFEAEQKKFDAVKSVKNFLPEGATDVDFGKAYLKETNSKKRDEYYTEAADNESKYKRNLYTAVGVWAANMVWTAFIPADNKRFKKVSPSLGWNNYSSTPLLGLTISIN